MATAGKKRNGKNGGWLWKRRKEQKEGKEPRAMSAVSKGKSWSRFLAEWEAEEVRDVKAGKSKGR